MFICEVSSDNSFILNTTNCLTRKPSLKCRQLKVKITPCSYSWSVMFTLHSFYWDLISKKLKHHFKKSQFIDSKHSSQLIKCFLLDNKTILSWDVIFRGKLLTQKCFCYLKNYLMICHFNHIVFHKLLCAMHSAWFVNIIALCLCH